MQPYDPAWEDMSDHVVHFTKQTEAGTARSSTITVSNPNLSACSGCSQIHGDTAWHYQYATARVIAETTAVKIKTGQCNFTQTGQSFAILRQFYVAYALAA